MTNLKLWDSFASPPQSVLRPISGGRLAGFTDINPQWRMKVLTEQFGPCGFGWKYEIVGFWTKCMDVPGGRPCQEEAVFCQINLYVKIGDDWSAPIPGIGGSRLITTEKKGMYLSDEGYKMALTDAISVAAKALGVGANIYMGQYDGSKYRDDSPGAFVPPVATAADLALLKKQWRTKFMPEATDKAQLLSSFTAWCQAVLGKQDVSDDPNRWTHYDLQRCREAIDQAPETTHATPAPSSNGSATTQQAAHHPASAIPADLPLKRGTQIPYKSGVSAQQVYDVRKLVEATVPSVSWTEFVTSALGRQFNPNNPDEWTPQELSAITTAMNVATKVPHA